MIACAHEARDHPLRRLEQTTEGVVVSRGDGVIRDPEIHRQVLLDVLDFAQQAGFQIRGLIKSPLLGPMGSAEFLVWLGKQGTVADVTILVEELLVK